MVCDGLDAGTVRADHFDAQGTERSHPRGIRQTPNGLTKEENP